MNASPINECNRIPGDGVTYAVAQFELTRQWGEGKTAAADGTHFETYEDNLLAEHHIRYGKSGGIAYRHIPDNYIALFSRFIACGTYEATFILDALLRNLSDLQPKRVHADTHGQSAAVFGLAYLLGIELMPRIRRRSRNQPRGPCLLEPLCDQQSKAFWRLPPTDLAPEAVPVGMALPIRMAEGCRP
jgi:Tn3 transposase DDE domain